MKKNYTIYGKLQTDAKKVMLEIDKTWNWKGILHFELLPPGKTIDSKLYHYPLNNWQDYNKPEKNWVELVTTKKCCLLPDHIQLWLIDKVERPRIKILVPDSTLLDYRLFLLSIDLF